MTPEQRRELLSREMEQSTGMSQRERELFNQCENLKAERDALQAELSSLKTDMFVLNNDMGYTTGILDDVLKQRDALRAELEDVDNERINVIADAEAVLRESAKKQDALQARVDGAVMLLNNFMLGGKSDDVYDAIKILTGDSEKEKILKEFKKKMSHQVELDPEISKILSDNFWDLIEDSQKPIDAEFQDSIDSLAYKILTGEGES